MLRLIALGDQGVYLRAASFLFPVAHVAAAALIDAWATNLEIVAGWTAARTTAFDPRLESLREEAAALRGQLAHASFEPVVTGP